MKFLAFIFLIALIIGAVIYIVSTVKKARHRGETERAPRDPLNFLYRLLPGYLTQEEKKKTWVSILVIVVSAYAAVGVFFTPGTDPNECGDYTLKNGNYIYTEGRGD